MVAKSNLCFENFFINVKIVRFNVLLEGHSQSQAMVNPCVSEANQVVGCGEGIIYLTSLGASNWYWLTVGQGRLSL